MKRPDKGLDFELFKKIFFENWVSDHENDD